MHLRQWTRVPAKVGKDTMGGQRKEGMSTVVLLCQEDEPKAERDAAKAGKSCSKGVNPQQRGLCATGLFKPFLELCLNPQCT